MLIVSKTMLRRVTSSVQEWSASNRFSLRNAFLNVHKYQQHKPARDGIQTASTQTARRDADQEVSQPGANPKDSCAEQALGGGAQTGRGVFVRVRDARNPDDGKGEAMKQLERQDGCRKVEGGIQQQPQSNDPGAKREQSLRSKALEQLVAKEHHRCF